MTPEAPLYIISKNRADTRMTSKALEKIGVPYSIVIEEQEFSDYAAVIDKSKILVLDEAYQRDYDTFDKLGDSKSKGPGPARNFVWDHAVAAGHHWHWVMDDNIRRFYRLNKGSRIPVGDGTIFRAMEIFADRYSNVAMAGPNYHMFGINPRKSWVKHKIPPYILNTRIYSCNLIRNDVPFRWRGRYNEDTDLSLRMLKSGWVTVQFNAFLQQKMETQAITGGNTEEFYDKEGTYPKSKMQVDMHPDVSRMIWRFGRCHHYVDYKPFAINKLRRKPDVEIPQGVDNFGMELKKADK
jgi:hypothetical protein